MAGLNGRWLQLGLGIVGMILIANLQYSWTLFVGPMDAAHHWGRGAIQVAFSVFIITETWLLPIEGYLVDRIGPRFATMAGGVLVAAGWSLNAYADRCRSSMSARRSPGWAPGWSMARPSATR